MFKIIFLLFPIVVFAQVFQAQGPIQLKPFSDKSGFIFMPDAMECTALKSTDGNYKETQCDYTMPYTSKMDGMKLILKNNAWADYSYMTVRHPLAGEVGRFGTKIMFDSSKQDQGWIETNYDAEITMGLILRIHYFTKNTVNDVDIIINYRLHKVVP